MLTAVTPDLALRRVPYRTMGIWLGRQLVVIRLPAGGLWIHSPIPWDDNLRTALAHMGPVTHVIGPNRYHDECLQSFQTEYPEAQFHAAPGLASSRTDVRFVAEPLGDIPHPDWREVIDQHLVRGMPRLNEVVFFHRPSRSLILADLAFDLKQEGPWLSRWALRLTGAWGRLTPSRFCRSMMQDRPAVRRSIDTILGWDFDRIIAGHGRNIETGGRAAFRDAFAFLS